MRPQDYSSRQQPNPEWYGPARIEKQILADGIRHHQAGRLRDAERIYRHILNIDPQHADSLHLLGVIACQTGQYQTAIQLIGQAIQISRHNPVYHCNLGTALKATGRIDDAVAHYRRAIVLKPDYADAHNNLANVLAEQGMDQDAIAHYRQVLAINPGHAEASNNLGNTLKDQGRFEDAMAQYDRALVVRPDYAEVYHNRAELKTFRRGDPDLATLQALAANADLSSGQALYVHFALAKALDDCGDYASAFEHMRKGNSLKRQSIQYDEADTIGCAQRTAKVFDRDLLERFQGEGDPSQAPIFVVGMPRSGSTLIEQILASHPRIHGAGELTALEAATLNVLNSAGPRLAYPECVPAFDGGALRRIAEGYLARVPALADGETRMVDKLPANFFNIGLIRLILPNARIIHARRHPIDTCLSCYSKLFASGQHFSYDMAELGHYYRSYDSLMDHWRAVLPSDAMLEVSYEDVLADLEGQARRLIEYCGLDWDDRCIDFHVTRRPVKTASAAQVRQPLFRSSLQRWRNYESHLTPLLQALAS